MSAALTPDLALAYLGELSTDIRASVVLDAHGERLAGDVVLAGAIRALLVATDTPGIEVLSARGGVFVARGVHHVVALVTGRFALPALVRHDARRAVADLDAGLVE